MTMKLLTASKFNIVEWPKMYKSQDGIKFFSRGDTLESPYLVLGASCLGRQTFMLL